MSEPVWPSRAQIAGWLTATGAAQQELLDRARAIRHEYCSDQVLLRGLVEISSYCQKKCDYCAMRAPNRKLERYRLASEDILAAVAEIKHHDLNIVFLQGGQDPHGDEILEEVIPAIRREFGLPVLLNLGERPKHVYRRFVELGADSYILKFEASDPQLYQDVIHAPIERRLACTRWIQEVGMKLGTGNIVGLPGQTVAHLIDDILFGVSLRPDFISSAPFIPNEDTPLEELASGSVSMAANNMAIWRILLRTPRIPTVSAMEKILAGGQLLGLNAGANVMTINFTPSQWRGKYAIYSRDRFVVSLDHARRTIERAGLRVAGGTREGGPAGNQVILGLDGLARFPSENRRVPLPLRTPTRNPC
jgi:biotin synthase